MNNAGKLCLAVSDVGVLFRGNNIETLLHSFSSTFSRRYIPDYKVLLDPAIRDLRIGARVHWEWAEEGFNILSSRYDDEGVDEYVVSSSIPGAYVNESPFFFILQVLARVLAKRGAVVFTDTVSFLLPNGKAVLLMGYQHSGKSTIIAIAASNGLIPLSTENTIIDANTLRIIGGTSILVYDPKIIGLYNVKLPAHEETRHGYLVVDLNKLYPKRKDILRNGVEVQEIYILHCSFRSIGADRKTIKGRKIKKTLWYFATSLIKGMDYYEPGPLDTPFRGKVFEHVNKTLQSMVEQYSGKIYEIYGRHDQVYEEILEKTL